LAVSFTDDHQPISISVIHIDPQPIPVANLIFGI